MDKNEVFENYHFIVVKRLLIVGCIWPYQNKTLKFYGRAFIIFAIFTMMMPQMITFFQKFYADERDLRILIKKFVGFVYFNTVFCKLYMNVYTEKKFQHLYETMAKDYKQIEELKERAAIDELRDFARNLIIIYTSCVFVALNFFVFKPQAIPAISDVIWPLNESRHKTICYYAEHFIDQDKYLHILVLHTFVVVTISLIVFVAVDISFVAVSYHVLGLFNVLTCHLKRLSEWTNNDANQEDERLHNFVIDTIKIHNKTLEFAELVRTTYDVCNFVVYGTVVFATSIGTILLALNITNPEHALRYGVFFTAVVMYLLFMNLPDQRFLDSSDELAESIYSCNWYQLSTRTQFLMRFMMMRCLIPCQLTAGPLFRMNFAFCGSIMRTAISFTSWRCILFLELTRV